MFFSWPSAATIVSTNSRKSQAAFLRSCKHTANLFPCNSRDHSRGSAAAGLGGGGMGIAVWPGTPPVCLPDRAPHVPPDCVKTGADSQSRHWGSNGVLMGFMSILRVTGGVPEWLKGADCKSVGVAYVGSNPTSPTIRLHLWIPPDRRTSPSYQVDGATGLTKIIERDLCPCDNMPV